MNDVILSLPVWGVLLTGVLILSLKLWNKNREYFFTWTSGVAICGLVSTGLCVMYFWMGKESISFVSKSFVWDSFRVGAIFLLLSLAGVVILISPFHPQVDLSKLSEIFFLYLSSIAGFIVLVLSNHLLLAFIGLELASMAFYLLIALGKERRALIAGFQYFVLGSVASAILLYGVALVMGLSGEFDLIRLFQVLPDLLSRFRLINVGFVFILIGFLFKVSVFPFQFWLPDIYRASFTPLLILMVGGWKIAVFTALHQWLKNTGSMEGLSVFILILQWLAVFSVVFGNVLAFLQKDFKKLLLFSTISHSGYLLMILISAIMGSTLASAGLFYYLIIYTVTTIGAFLCLWPLEREDSFSTPLLSLRNYAQSHPLLAILTSGILLSLAGLPPFGGFVAKLFLFQSLVDQGFWWMLFWTILGSSLAFWYYLKPIAIFYMEQITDEDTIQPLQKASMQKVSIKPPKLFITCVHVLLTIGAIGLGLFPVILEF